MWSGPSVCEAGVRPFTGPVLIPIADNEAGKVYIMLEDRLSALFKKEEEYSILGRMKGAELVGKKYQALFPYFKHLNSSEPDQGAFRVLRYVGCLGGVQGPQVRGAFRVLRYVDVSGAFRVLRYVDVSGGVQGPQVRRCLRGRSGSSGT